MCRMHQVKADVPLVVRAYLLGEIDVLQVSLMVTAVPPVMPPGKLPQTTQYAPERVA